MAEQTVRDIMTKDPVTVGPELSVTDAAKMMVERKIGALPVVEGGLLKGFVTEGDLIVKDIKLEFPTYLHLLDGFIMYPPMTAKFEHELKKAVAATVGDVMSRTRPPCKRRIRRGCRYAARRSRVLRFPCSTATSLSASSPSPTCALHGRRIRFVTATRWAGSRSTRRRSRRTSPRSGAHPAGHRFWPSSRRTATARCGWVARRAHGRR
jgi:hypothetical protein